MTRTTYSSQPEIKECLDRKWPKYLKNKILKLGLDTYQSPTLTNRLHHILGKLSILGNRHDNSSLSIKGYMVKTSSKNQNMDTLHAYEQQLQHQGLSM